MLPYPTNSAIIDVKLFLRLNVLLVLGHGKGRL
jgi:hypothetical protein